MHSVWVKKTYYGPYQMATSIDQILRSIWNKESAIFWKFYYFIPAYLVSETRNVKNIFFKSIRRPLIKFHYCLSVLGESEGYTVKSKEKDIAISDYPLLQTEFLYASKKGKAEIEWEFPVILIDFSSDVFSV